MSQAQWRDYGAIDNFFRVNQWNFLLIGETGTGIFFHKDHLAAASWQAAVVGRKRWILCPYDQNHLLSEELFTFKPDYSSHMGKRAASAVSGLVQSSGCSHLHREELCEGVLRRRDGGAGGDRVLPLLLVAPGAPHLHHTPLGCPRASPPGRLA